MTPHRPSLRPALLTVALVAMLSAPLFSGSALAQPRELGPPAGTDLEGTETEPVEQSQKAVDAPVIPRGGMPSVTAPKVPGAAGAKSGEQNSRTGTRASDLGRGGNISDLEIPLDIPITQIPNYRAMMRDMVQELSRYARGRNPKFVVLARPGFDLLTWSTREYDLAELQRDPTKVVPLETIRQINTPMTRYAQALDGFVLNGHFCSPLRVPHVDLEAARNEGLRALSFDKCPDESAVRSALQNAARTGIITYATTDGTFGSLPRNRPFPENPANVEAIAQARNMMAMLSAKAFGSRDEWLAALQANNYDVLVVDPFDRKDRALTKDELHALKFKQIGARRLVLATLDVGYANDTKFYWQPDWQIGTPSWIVGANPDAPSQYATEFWNPAWKAIVGKYLAGLMDLGFDGVVLDGVEAYRRWEAKTPIAVTRLDTN